MNTPMPGWLCSMGRRTLVAVVCIHAAAAGQYAPNLELDGYRDEFILRLSSRYGVPQPPQLLSQPVTAAHVRSFLAACDSLDSAGVLTRGESRRLVEVGRLVKGESALTKWRRPARDMTMFTHLSILGALEPRYTTSASTNANLTICPGVDGNIKRFSYFAAASVWTDYLSDSMYRASDYQPYHGNPYNLYGRNSDSGNVRSSDGFRAGIRYSWDWLELETAVDHLRQGPAVFFPLTFSGCAPPILYARAELDLGPVGYRHIVGQLKHQKDKPKYLYAHRLDFNLWKKRLTIGINEAIVGGSTTDEIDSLDPHNALRRRYYGEQRDWEWTYMIPLVPFKFAEHYLGDRDNGAVSLDVNLHFPRAFRWYGEFFLDDISDLWTLFNDDFGNKWALTAGMQYFADFLSRDWTATVEYSRVEPWVYTHFYGGSHTYTHFDQPLGSPLGPNTDALVFDIHTQLAGHHELGIRFTNVRGNRGARGGSITDVFQDSVRAVGDSTYATPYPDSYHKTFLGRGSKRSTRLGITWAYGPFGRFRVASLFEYDFSPDDPGFFAKINGAVVW